MHSSNMLGYGSATFKGTSRTCVDDFLTYDYPTNYFSSDLLDWTISFADCRLSIAFGTPNHVQEQNILAILLHEGGWGEQSWEARLVPLWLKEERNKCGRGVDDDLEEYDNRSGKVDLESSWPCACSRVKVSL